MRLCPARVALQVGGRRECKQPKGVCKFCGCDHHPLLCPFGEGSKHRDEMPREASPQDENKKKADLRTFQTALF